MTSLKQWRDYFILALHLLKVSWQMLRGVWRVTRLPQPCVSIFGGHEVTQKDIFAQKATTIATQLIRNNISVLTGGGPGIMQAANCGAIYKKQGKIRTLGITVKGIDDLEGGINPCAKE